MNYTKDELQKLVDNVPYWYHKIKLPHDITTPGWAPLNLFKYNLPESFEGKRVLDVGAWDGFFTFLALSRGAKEVVAIDDFSDTLNAEQKDNTNFNEKQIESIMNRKNKKWETFDLCKKALGYTDKECKRKTISVYDINEEILGGKFDIIFLFGTLYHLKYPMYALDKLGNLCREEMYVESAISDDLSPYGKVRIDVPILQFYPQNEYGGNHTNWFVPNMSALANMIHVCGFDKVYGWKLIDNKEEVTNMALARGFCKALKKKSIKIEICTNDDDE